MNELHLFAGAGGGVLGGMLCGHTCVCAVELEEYPRRVLLQRQRDGILPRFPIWDDITTFDGTPWRGRVDVVCGGFPCQDISAAGKGAGITGARSGLWSEMARVIGEVGPRFVFVENSPMLVSRGLDTVLSDLAEMGYDADWGVVGGRHAGAPTKRDRMWILAHAADERLPRSAHHRNDAPQTQRWYSGPEVGGLGAAERVDRWRRHAALLDHGIACSLGEAEAIGNMQIPAVAALAWRILSGHSNCEKTTADDLTTAMASVG